MMRWISGGVAILLMCLLMTSEGNKQPAHASGYSNTISTFRTTYAEFVDHRQALNNHRTRAYWTRYVGNGYVDATFYKLHKVVSWAYPYQSEFNYEALRRTRAPQRQFDRALAVLRDLCQTLARHIKAYDDAEGQGSSTWG